MIQRERQYTLGIETDLPPDKLEERALRTLNVAPVSGVSVAPRGGTVLEGHYGGGTLGRQIVVDALPHQSGGRLLVVAVNTRMADGSLQSAVEGLAQYTPKMAGGWTLDAIARPAPVSWAAEVPEAISDSLYGWVL